MLSGDGDDFKPGTYKLRTNEDYDIIVRDAQRRPAGRAGREAA